MICLNRFYVYYRVDLFLITICSPKDITVPLQALIRILAPMLYPKLGFMIFTRILQHFTRILAQKNQLAVVYILLLYIVLASEKNILNKDLPSKKMPPL